MRLLSVLSVFAGCTTEDSSDDTADEADICYEQTEPFEVSPVLQCELDAPCDVVLYDDGYCGLTQSSDFYDATDGACVVDALKDGAPGVFTIRECSEQSGGQYSTEYLLQSFGDGTLLWSAGGPRDDTSTGYITWRVLPEASWFEACSTETSAELFVCLGAILEEDCLSGEPTCPG